MFERKPGKIIVHANTFDLTKQINSLDLYEKILNEHNKILPSTELVFSEIILRKDNPCLINIQKKTNERLKNFCQQLNIYELQICLRFLKFYFKLEKINVFVLRGVLFSTYVQLKAPLLAKKTAVKSEIHFSREAIEN